MTENSKRLVNGDNLTSSKPTSVLNILREIKPA